MVFRFLFQRRPASSLAPARNESSIRSHEPSRDHAYPPVDPGLPARSVEELLAPHMDFIARIKLAYGADGETFHKDLYGLIERYARYVNMLPATADNYFSGAGGLFRLGLEIAFYALQATDGQIFSGRSTITNRRHLEPRWRTATFIAGLCCELHRTLSHLVVSDEHGNEWPAYMVPLTDWLGQQHAQRFFLRWVPNAQESRSLGVFALPHIIPQHTLHYLAQDNAVVVPHMMAAISGMPAYREHNILDQLVRHASALVIDRDLTTSADRIGKPQLGSHLERYLVDAMRRLVLGNTAWLPNGEKSRVWYGVDGLFIVWPHACADIVRLLEADQLPGIPRSPETMLDILLDAGVLQARDASAASWMIYPPEAKDAIEAVKLKLPDILLVALTDPPAPLPHPLTNRPPPQQAGSGNRKKDGPARPVQLALPVEQAPQPPSATPKRQDDTPTAASTQNKADAPTAARTATADHAGSSAAPGDITAVPDPVFAFLPHPRMNPALAGALSEIVATLNGAKDLACRTLPQGLFVPLSALESRGIDPATAIRELADLSLLAVAKGEKIKTITASFGDGQKIGVVIATGHISGLDPANFVAPPSA